MVRISEWANLHNQRARLSFVDIDTNRDLPLFIDPYAIDIRDDPWSIECSNNIRSFFNALLTAIREGNDARTIHLASHLRETNETCLGYSSGRPQGRGIGDHQAAQIIRALRDSRAFQTGLLADLAETQLFIEGIGSDKISDLTTNVIRSSLVRYTQEQADLWGMNLTDDITLAPIWDANREDWIQATHRTIVIGGRPILLVPKFSVRYKLGLNAQEFYNNHMVVALQQEYLNAGHALVTVLKNGRATVYKKNVKEKHPLYKDDLADFARQHPQALEQYKRLAGAKGPLSDEELYADFDESSYARLLINELRAIPLGSDDASNYHKYCIGVFTFLFYPELINPWKEREIDQGRKRIDIAFKNAATEGFFNVALQSPQMRCIELPIECKNYSKDAANPELDQLCGRFSHVRGFLGILASRNATNRTRLVERCKDAAIHRNQFVLPILDDDIIAMLELVENGERSVIDRYLRELFAEITS